MSTQPVDTGDPVVDFPPEPDVEQDTTPLDPDPDEEDQP